MSADATLGKRVAVWTVSRLIERSLRSDFRRIMWVGPEPWTEGSLAPDRPTVLYTNHHSFHDGYLLWLLACRTLGRPALIWMNEWERAPLFGPLGALPFPLDDERQRLATIRETAHRLQERPAPVFFYFPEGELRPPDAGLAAFSPDRFTRLARLFPDDVQWWPVGIRATWWGEDRPTALLTGSDLHDQPDGDEYTRLAHTLDALQSVQPGEGRLLLDGARSAHERWDLSLLAPLLRRWT